MHLNVLPKLWLVFFLSSGPFLDLICIRLLDAAHCNINKNVPFFLKTLVFDRLSLNIDLNVSFYNYVGCCLNFLEYALVTLEWLHFFTYFLSSILWYISFMNFKTLKIPLHRVSSLHVLVYKILIYIPKMRFFVTYLRTSI